MTPEQKLRQRRRNLRLGLVLLFIVVAIFAWTMLRGGSMFAGMGEY
jgi:predicted nucleic acid-binding Zn ribbon protein